MKTGEHNCNFFFLEDLVHLVTTFVQGKEKLFSCILVSCLINAYKAYSLSLKHYYFAFGLVFMYNYTCIIFSKSAKNLSKPTINEMFNLKAFLVYQFS